MPAQSWVAGGVSNVLGSICHVAMLEEFRDLQFFILKGLSCVVKTVLGLNLILL